MAPLSHCRSCGSDRIAEIFSFGEMPLANRLLKPDEIGTSERLYPLDVAFCEDCSLVQITQTVPAEELFSDYVYFSSFSDLVVANAQENVERVLAMRALGAEDLVVEIASNDGYLLQHYRQHGLSVVGIEPA